MNVIRSCSVVIPTASSTTMKNIIWFILCAYQVQAQPSSDPCHQYETIGMPEGGYRSTDFNSFYTDISLCDTQIDESIWYRFDMDAGSRLSEKPVEPWYCGTQEPLWLNGTHPTDFTPVTGQICGTGFDSYCEWSGTTTIQMCNETEIFYVYLLPRPNGCPLAYCVDATTRKQCQSPLIWISNEFRCGENITKTTTVAPSTPTSVPTTTPPPGTSGWSSWGPWSLCSKPCDYGIQSRKRTCYDIPCLGKATDYQLCSKHNCKEVEEEKLKGIIIIIAIVSKEDTMVKVVQGQDDINQIVRDSINRICSSNASLCCGKHVNSEPASGTIFVSYYDIYTPQGHPTINNDGSVNQKIIAVVNEDVDRAICQASPDRIARQAQTKNYISYEVMAMAVKGSENTITTVTGLTIKSYEEPTITEYDADDTSSCPLTTCVVPIVVSLAAVAIIIAIVSVCMVLSVKKGKNRVELPPPYIGDSTQSSDPGYPIPYKAVTPGYMTENVADNGHPSIEGKNQYQEIPDN